MNLGKCFHMGFHKVNSILLPDFVAAWIDAPFVSGFKNSHKDLLNRLP